MGAEHEATPEVASVQVHWTVTGPLFQPCALGAVVRVPVMLGGVLSIFTAAVVCEAVLPAASCATPITPGLAPSTVTTTSAGHEATPEAASVQVKCAVTALVYQPFRPAVPRS